MIKSAILLSGGMDSIALAFSERPNLAITVDYGQLAAAGEINAAAAVSKNLSIPHIVIAVDLSALGSGDMAGRRALGVAPASDWWPYRNQVLVTLAAMRVIGEGVSRLLIGTVKGDSAHADGRQEFVTLLSALLQFQEGGIELVAPAIELTTVELVRSSAVPLELLAWAHSCHLANHACGNCRGCHKHYETLTLLGLEPY